MCSLGRVQQGLSLAGLVVAGLSDCQISSRTQLPLSGLSLLPIRQEFTLNIPTLDCVRWGGGVCAPTWEWSGVFFRGTGSGARQTLVLPVPAGKPWANLCTSLGFLFHILKVFPIPWGVFQVMLLSSHKDLFSYLLMHPATSCLRVFARAVPSA